MTRESLFDNMATVVLGRVGRDRQPLWNPELLAFAEYFGTVPKLCRVAHPDRKGEVEALLGYSERDFLRGRAPATLRELNQQAERWLREIANRRQHGTTGRVPEEAWEEEKPFLIALPETGYPGACQVEYRSVAEDCTVSISGTRYTVPARLAHRQVRVRLYAERFEVMDPQGGIAFARDYAVGEEAQRLPREGDDVRVMVRYPKETRESLDSLRDLRIRTSDGRAIPLEQVAEISFAPGINRIQRRERMRSVAVYADLVGDNARQTIAADMEQNFWPEFAK